MTELAIYVKHTAQYMFEALCQVQPIPRLTSKGALLPDDIFYKQQQTIRWQHAQIIFIKINN